MEGKERRLVSTEKQVMALAIVIYVLFFGWRCWVLYDDAGYLFLQVTMSSSVNSMSRFTMI